MMTGMQRLESRNCGSEARAVGLAGFGQQGSDKARRFREAATAREIEMDEDMHRACKGPGAATLRHPVASLPDLPSKTSCRTRK